MRSICHFLMSFGIICLSVGIKFGLSEEYAHYHRSHAWMLVGGLSFTLVCLHVSRFTNFYDMDPDDALLYGIPGFSYTRSLYLRWAVWGLQLLIAVCMLPLAAGSACRDGPR